MPVRSRPRAPRNSALTRTLKQTRTEVLAVANEPSRRPAREILASDPTAPMELPQPLAHPALRGCRCRGAPPGGVEESGARGSATAWFRVSRRSPGVPLVQIAQGGGTRCRVKARTEIRGYAAVAHRQRPIAQSRAQALRADGAARHRRAGAARVRAPLPSCRRAGSRGRCSSNRRSRPASSRRPAVRLPSLQTRRGQSPRTSAHSYGRESNRGVAMYQLYRNASMGLSFDAFRAG